MHITGSGASNRGAIHATAGDHTLTERIALQGDASIHLDAASSITFGGLQGRFYNPHTLTQTGAGTAVYDNISSIGELAVVNGIAAGTAASTAR
jgi:hypothetical protein